MYIEIHYWNARFRTSYGTFIHCTHLGREREGEGGRRGRGREEGEGEGGKKGEREWK